MLGNELILKMPPNYRLATDGLLVVSCPQMIAKVQGFVSSVESLGQKQSANKTHMPRFVAIKKCRR